MIDIAYLVPRSWIVFSGARNHNAGDLEATVDNRNSNQLRIILNDGFAVVEILEQCPAEFD